MKPNNLQLSGKGVVRERDMGVLSTCIDVNVVEYLNLNSNPLGTYYYHIWKFKLSFKRIDAKTDLLTITRRGIFFESRTVAGATEQESKVVEFIELLIGSDHVPSSHVIEQLARVEYIE